ncbi:hypothetical protein BDK51DRAFT_40640 [Blyttiomyces helicus]|uniref:SH3 domain-containing protein n=1 Tax=Blyttiomyces helicus TaxID=388810 RepID=A0A4P9WC33_9FUNG|nr:hypothetical protein BDK51DRAFT_40640 [Blyttiomyces helicus]|eukprot:RKO88748.1 hypothetical protein BDK51DRAFT_40640 [Blyttiomyces helicus]
MTDTETDAPPLPLVSTSGKALWDYDAIEDNELSFKSGDLIEILELCNVDWFEGKLGQASGYFPANRVELIPAKGYTMKDIEAIFGTAVAASDTPQPTAEAFPTSETSRPVGPPSPAPTIKSETPSESPSKGTSARPPSIKERSPIAVNEASPKSPVGVSESIPDTASLRGETASLPPSSILPEEGFFADGDDGASVDSSSNRTEDANLEGWHTVTNSDGEVYYWNVNTGETSWESPLGDSGEPDDAELNEDSDSAIPRETSVDSIASSEILGGSSQMVGASAGSLAALSNRTVHTSPSDMSLSKRPIDTDEDAIMFQIESVPPEIIRREGPLGLKARKAADGKEPKKYTSWQNLWAVVCVGFLIFFKEEPAKNKKVYIITGR